MSADRYYPSILDANKKLVPAEVDDAIRRVYDLVYKLAAATTQGIDGGGALIATTTIQIRHATAAQWASADPVLRAGEMAFETDTNTLKIGDGVLKYSALSAI